MRSLVGGDAVILNSAGAPRLSTIMNVTISGSTDGYLTREDRLAALKGHLSNPKSLHQIEVTPGAARIWNVHQGEVIPIGFYAPQQANLPGFGTSKVKPIFTVRATVTAIVAMNGEIIQDDVDRAYGFAFITPAMVKRAEAIDPDWKDPVYYAMQLRHGDNGLASVEAQLVRLVPPDYANEFHVSSVVTATVELAIKPESVALGAFGLIAALVCLILSTQSLSRQVRQGNDERRILQSLGASHSDTFAESMIGTVGSVTLGVVVAVLVAAALSPLAPLGPVRAVYPDRGISWDWTVLGLGAVILMVVLGSASVLIALANSPHRLRSATSAGPRRSVSVRRLQVLGLPLAATVGAHFALESPRGRGEVPVRSILVGAVMAVTLMATTLTFSSGLHTLISRPALYGWNWNYMLNPSNNVPPAALRELNHDPDVAKWSGADYTDITIDGLTVPMVEMNAGAKVQPPILSGHGIENNHQIVLGNQSLALLHKKVGQTVTVSYGSPENAPVYIPPFAMTIVGTATFPAVGLRHDRGRNTRRWAPAHSSPRTATAILHARHLEQGPDPQRTRNGIRATAPGCQFVSRKTKPREDRPHRKRRLQQGSPSHRELRHGVGRAATGPDRGLPLDRRHSGAARHRAGRRCRHRLGAHPYRVGATTTTRPRDHEDVGFHETNAGGRGGVAGDDRRTHRRGHRHTSGHTLRPRTLDALRARHQRRAAADGAGSRHRPRWCRHRRRRDHRRAVARS